MRLLTIFAGRGIEQLYTHQAEAVTHALEGRNVVITTPTASGKTLCYNLPILDAIVREPSTRALYLFPTKALAQDQLAELEHIADALEAASLQLSVFTYDGDTPQDARRSIRTRAHLVLTNPDMLHSGILPHHPRWAKLFENLRYVVIDELHAYRGVFGSHLANVLRRLRRICASYGSRPQFICSSATIANPRELAERLTEQPCEVVSESGAPQGEKVFLFVNPPVVNRQLGIRRSYVWQTRQVAMEFLTRNLQVIVFAQSRLTTEILTRYLKESFSAPPGTADAVRGYRGGYLPLRRREIERGLRQGSVRAVVSTNALELGIDIGALDAAVLAGYPGTIAATWQRAGRAGRRASRSAAVLVASSAPLDQFIVRHPSYFFDSSPEHALVNPDNLHILLDHIKCAAFELPFGTDDRFGGEPPRRAERGVGVPASEEPGGVHGVPAIQVQDVLRILEEEGLVHFTPAGAEGDAGMWYWTSDSYPADAVSLRSVSSDNFVVVDVTGKPRVIGEVDFISAPSTLHPKAVYIVEGQLFQVERLDFDGRKALVRETDTDYYTDAITYTRVSILEEFASGSRVGGQGSEGTDTGAERARSGQDAGASSGRGCAAHGEVHVVSRVVGFKKIKFHTNENVGSGELDLPEQQMHTTSYWLTIRSPVMSNLPFGADDRRDGVVGLSFAMKQVARLLLMCDAHDIGISVGDEESRPLRPFESLGVVPSRVGERQAQGRLAARPRDGVNAPQIGVEPRIFVYDNYPGGIGFSRPLYDMSHELLRHTRELIAQCPCEAGCPSCVGPVGYTGPLAKTVALKILDLL
ncbi:MAG: DEAD/DEAH box helicase [Acidobacteria bacterium]|nr:DEAD/DEAH box helicase [Acidobacteriota bacterium]